jgi:tetratricopeptide (TPR) repeat protein
MVPMAIEDGNATALYRYDKETVVIYDREDRQYQWVGDLGTYLDNLRDEGEIIELDDEYMGQVAHRVSWPMMGDEGYIDPETKLPIAIGETLFSYEEPPEGMFEIVIPEGYAVVDLRDGAETGDIPQWVRDMDRSDDSFRQATHALARGEFAEAAELFEHVTEQEPGRNWAWYWLGSAYYGLGKYELAVDKYTKVIEMFEEKGCHYCYYARGLAYKQLGMAEAAAADMEACLGMLITALRKPKAAGMFEYAGNPLIRYGEYKPSEAEMVVNTIDRLQIGTGLDFGFDPNGTAEEKEAAIAAWEHWYQESYGSP